MKRHPFDAVSFVFGGVLIALGLLVASGETARLFSAWLAPSVVILLGVVLLVAGWRSTRTSSTEPDAGS